MPVAPGQTRVLVLDECHLLSQAAASALLKTLEEPPPQVVFVLATTDPHKLLPTIRSRCLEIPFTEVPAVAIESRLAELAAEHSLELSGEQVQAIAVAAGGDLRRAMKLLQTSGTDEATFLLDTTEGSRELLAARLVLAVAEGDLPKAAAEGRLLFGGQGSRRLTLPQAFSLLGEQIYRLNLLLAGVPAAELRVSALEAKALGEASQLLTPGRGLAWAEALTSSWSALADAPLADEPALGLVLLRMLRAKDQPAAAAPGPAPSASPGLPTVVAVTTGPIETPKDAAAWPAAITGLEPGLASLLGKAQLVSLANGVATLKASSITRQRLQPRLMEAATVLGLAIELVG